MTVLKQFRERLYSEWLPTFCLDEKRNYPPEGFRPESIKVSEFDAANFMRALDTGLVQDSGGGRFRCAKSSAFEQIFWSGKKSISPRPTTLWIEPIITIGTVARLVLDFGWEPERIGMQSIDWAFDFAVFKRSSDNSEYIAGEVKKTNSEIDHLTSDLSEFARLRSTECKSLHPRKVNSYRKWAGLQRSKAPLFWAVGPDDYTVAYSVKFDSNNTASFTQVSLDSLMAS